MTASVSTWWEGIDRDLAAVPTAAEAEHVPLYSTEFSDTYKVRLTSVGPYRIAAWLSIPKGEGPFPALFLVPGYGSVVTPPTYEDRQRYVVMSLMHRGLRHADWPYAAKFPGLLTDGIADPEAWIFRGILADVLRGFDYLTSRPEVDPDRIGVFGHDGGLLVAARRPSVTAVAVTATFFTRLTEAAARTSAYPIEEINDWLRTYPEDTEAVHETLALVDPRSQAGAVGAKVLLAAQGPGSLGDQEWLAPLKEGLAGEAAFYDLTYEGQTDRDAIDAWLAGQLGAEPKPRIWEAQEIGSWS
ncbi:MAG TPA: acetylxylan esterase [Thermomicrobiales bacterium]|nr:acetylxylan esterase [Thermomicrobiales bacterium]